MNALIRHSTTNDGVITGSPTLVNASSPPRQNAWSRSCRWPVPINGASPRTNHQRGRLLMADSSKRIIAVSEHFYQRLLGAYPASFRHQYGTQMTQVFLDCCRVAYQQSGTRGVLQLWIPTLGDLVTNAIAEHISMLIPRLRRHKVLFHAPRRLVLHRQGGPMLHIAN